MTRLQGNAVHLVRRGSAACRHPKASKLSADEYRVTCQSCRRRASDSEDAPADAFRNIGLMVVSTIAGHDGRVLDLRNVIFVAGGSLSWFEPPDIYAVMLASKGGRVRRYQGVWIEAPTPAASAP